MKMGQSMARKGKKENGGTKKRKERKRKIEKDRNRPERGT